MGRRTIRGRVFPAEEVRTGRIVDLMTRRFVRYIRVEFWSWW
jgi:hypothetical protein